MKVLFDPTPVARLGVDLKTDNVFVGSDFSCVAFMVEEYLAHGMTTLVIPKSRPEASMVPDMPLPVQRRVEVCDDSQSIAAAGRILFHARLESGASYDEERGRVVFREGTPREMREQLVAAHDVVRRLAFAFNHKVSLEMNAESARASLRDIRGRLTQPAERSVIAELEGALVHYEPFGFSAVRPDRSGPTETLNALDQILNDASYAGYSTAVAHLGPAEHRQRALSDVRRYGRLILESRLASLGWSTFSAVVSAFTGAKLPTFQDFKKDLPPQPMPLMLDLHSARQSAIDSWKVNPPKEAVTSNRENFGSSRSVAWLSPCPSISAPKTGAVSSSMGTVGELLDILQRFEQHHPQGSG